MSPRGEALFVVLHAIRPGALRPIEDAGEALAERDCDLMPLVLRKRANFRAARIAARSAQEIDPHGKAVREIAALFDWIEAQLGIAPQMTTSPNERCPLKLKDRKRCPDPTFRLGS